MYYIKPSQEIAQHFYEATNRKANGRQFTLTINQATTLLEKGYDLQDIKDVVSYCATKPPKDGFHSLGWLFYCMDDVLKKIRVERIKTQTTYKQSDVENGTIYKIERIDSQKRVDNEFDFDMFKEDE